MTIYEKSLASVDAVLGKMSNEELLALNNQFEGHNYEGGSLNDYINKWTYLQSMQSFHYSNRVGHMPGIMWQPPSAYQTNNLQNDPEIARGLFFLCNIVL